MDDYKLYIPLDKTDVDQRMVYGYVSTEALDSQGEIVKQDALQAAMSEYMKFGNVREMHQPSAVGKTKQANTDNKGTYVAVKVVDDNAWKKVKEGVYNGFSIGGKVVNKVKNTITALKLSEISLVDRPANPEAVFDVIKMVDMAKDEASTSEFHNDAPTETSPSVETSESDTPESLDVQVASETVAVPVVEQIAEPVEDEVTSEADKQTADQPDMTKDAVDVMNLGSLMLGLGRLLQKETAEGDSETVSALQAAYDALKPAVVSEVNEPCDTEPEDGDVMMYADKTDDLSKTTQTTEERDALTDSDFAYIDAKGGRHLPINDTAHVRNAMARFNQTQFDSDSAKAKAKSKICAKAKTLGVEGDFCKLEADTDIEKTDPFTMPTDAEITAELTKQGVPVSEATLNLAKEAAAEKIMQSISTEIARRHDIDMQNHDLMIKLQALKRQFVQQSGQFVKFEGDTPAIPEPDLTTEATPLPPVVEPAETDKAELETALAKVARQSAELAELIAKVKRTPLPVTAKSSYVVERFSEATTSKETLAKQIDEHAELLKQNPHDPLLQAKAEQLQKDYLNSIR